GPFVVTVTLTGATEVPIPIDFATQNGTAVAGSDYTATSGTLNFPPSLAASQQLTFNVPITADNVVEPDETFTVVATNPIVGDNIDETNETLTMTLSGLSPNAILGTAVGTGTILGDDPPPAISINDVTVVEGNSGTTNAVFTVTLSNPSQTTVTVDYATSDGSATVADNDYAAIPTTTLTFLPGVTSRTISVVVNGDTRHESDETFNVNLSNPTGGAAAPALIADNQGVGTIQDDDTVPAISIDNPTVTEGGIATFNVTLDHPSQQTV